MATQEEHLGYLDLIQKTNENLQALIDATDATLTLNKNISAPIASLNKVKVITELPDSGDETTLYLVKVGEEGSNVYKEYIWYDNSFEELGSKEISASDISGILGISHGGLVELTDMLMMFILVEVGIV